MMHADHLRPAAPPDIAPPPTTPMRRLERGFTVLRTTRAKLYHLCLPRSATGCRLARGGTEYQ